MRKSGVITESEEASSAKCASSAPVFMLSIRLCRFCDGVIDTVVPGQTRTSPPLDRLSTVVSAPAVIVDPKDPEFPEIEIGPAARTADTTGSDAGATPTTVGNLNGEVSALSGSRPRCTTRRLPAASQVKARGATRSTTTRAIGGFC